MCVIIHKETDVKIELETLQNIIKANPDGLGVSFWDTTDKAWSTIKYLSPQDKDLQSVLHLIENTEAIIHARIATSGGVTTSNIHPFIGKRYTLFHNGVITSLNGVLSGYSDTRLLHKLIEQFELKQASELLKALALSSYSKFILIDNRTNKVYRFGEFEQFNKLWCSNLYFTALHTVWAKSPKTFHKNDITKVLSKDIVNKIADTFGGTFYEEDLQLIVEELEYLGLEPTWNNVQDIIKQWYCYK